MVLAHIFGRLIMGILRGMLHRWPSTLLALTLLVGGGLVLGSRGLIPGMPALSELPGVQGATAPAAAASDTREMVVENMQPVRNGEQVNVILKEKSGNRRLIVIAGMSEALGIAGVGNQEAARSEPSKTYDFMSSLVQELGGRVDRVVVNNVTDTTFYAKVIMRTDSRLIEVESRPSDAVALALRAKAPIFAEVSVLDKAGVLNPR